ncbi:predicted transcriptional regulator [Acidiphilium sp. CAG:727]|nr:predicted transcriptional regulator [Acidiphilium sp. CAG:727]
MDLNGDMIRGHIDTIILLSLVDGDKDSNEIRKNIEDRSDNKFSVKQGTFYSAMQRLVKQSLIKEYRSSATDGIRRKYFSLTEKGEKLVENNRKEWLESKEVIDTLVDTVQEKPENDLMMRTEDFPIPSENPYESPVLSAENDQKIDEKSIENLPEDAYDTRVTVHNETETQSEDDLLQDINAKLSDILGELGFENDKPDNENANNETFVEKNTSENVSKLQENKALPNAKINERRSYPFEITDSSLYVEDETDFNPTVEITVNHDETIRETEPEINVTDEVETADQNNEKPFIFDDNIEENEPIENIAQTENVTCETVEETNVSIDENPSETQTANDTNATFEYTAQEDKAANDEYSDEEDDLLAVEDGTTSNRREYKSILSSLFPKKEEKHAATEIETDNSEERTERNEQTRYFDDDYSPARSETDGYYEENVSSGRYPSDDETAEIANEKTDRRQQTYYDGEGSTDFSDLYNMAKREGFKIKASYNTNKYYGDRVFVNKLNFHSSIIWYLVLFVEMLIMNLTLSQIVNWSSSAKLILVFSTAVFPVVCFVIYNINKTKTAKELASFKDVIEIALIITFQITIIILCVALFASVDFGNIIEVTSFVLIPFIFALNIPIYFMIKYALYGTGKYFVGDKTTRK